MPDPSLSVRSQEQERQERADQRENNEFGDLEIRASRSRTQQPAQEQVDATADEESDEGGAAVLLGHLLIRSE